MPKGLGLAPIKERFDAAWEADTNGGCWLWTGFIEKGYGKFNMKRRDGKWGARAAYKVGFEIYRGDVPPGFDLDHLCRVRCCVNPWHLEIVAHRENCLRGVSMTARNHTKTACDRGHPYEGDSYTTYGGHRKCMVCSKMTCLDFYYKRTGRPHLSPLYCVEP